MRTWGSMITKGQMVDAVRNIIEEDTGDEFDDYGLRWRKETLLISSRNLQSLLEYATALMRRGFYVDGPMYTGRGWYRIETCPPFELSDVDVRELDGPQRCRLAILAQAVKDKVL